MLISTEQGTVQAYHHLDKGDTFDVDVTVGSADVVRGRTVTSWPSLQTDLRNAGATWQDQEVVVDDNLITSRNPDDIKAFTRELTAALSSSVTA